MNTNIGYAFYQDYYADLNFLWKGGKHIAVFDGTEKNEQLFAQKWSTSDGEVAKRYTDQLQNESIELQTVYPGLLIGSGYQHEILSGEKDDNGDAYVQNELKLGFHFDYTTGLPVIPGSSVKGAIRSAFEFETGYIVELLDEICKEDATWTALNTGQKRSIVDALEQTLFEHDGERCVYERDIFLDAFPVATGHRKGLFLGNDYITPHDSPLKSPNPVQFLKVLPQVSYHFAFRLSDSSITADQVTMTFLRAHKTNLFLAILKDFGVGAKTNVGYGQLEELDSHLPNLESLSLKDRVNCKIEKAIYRENEDKYQIYLIPEVKGYTEFLKQLGKPFPSVKISKGGNTRALKAMEEDAIVYCFVNRIGDDKRIFFKNFIEFQ
ncbi:MAG: type III-B CRISPR module RAMP protein Cmr6 [Flavobacteriales bacterium]|nr:type III-B CRISPR module RAMP protein Cmr6 [Flavobacteriales bacterium]